MLSNFCFSGYGKSENENNIRDITIEETFVLAFMLFCIFILTLICVCYCLQQEKELFYYKSNSKNDREDKQISTKTDQKF